MVHEVVLVVGGGRLRPGHHVDGGRAPVARPRRRCHHRGCHDHATGKRARAVVTARGRHLVVRDANGVVGFGCRFLLLVWFRWLLLAVVLGGGQRRRILLDGSRRRG